MKIEKYIKNIDLEKLLNKLKLEGIKPLENDVQALCPFHKENKASWGISKINGLYNCFTCGAKGNLITLVAKVKNISNKQAINFLYKFAGIKRDIIIDSKQVNRQIKEIVRQDKKFLKKLNQEEEDKYILKASIPKYVCYDFFYGLRYFKDRGINRNTLQKHDITFCTKGFYRNRAIIPIYDENGEMILFEARDITGLNEDKVLYPKNAKKSDTIYNINNVKNNKEVIVVEGIMDVLYLKERGFNVVGLFGIKISKKQEALLNKYFNRIYLAFDGDEKGYEALIKQAKSLSLHLSVYIITLPKNTDPDELTKEQFSKLKGKSQEINEYLSKKLINGVYNR